MPRPAKKGRAGKGSSATSSVVQLRLYLADTAPRSMEALARVRAILQDAPRARYDLRVVDALTEPRLALADGVIVTPALVRHGKPHVVVTGPFEEPGTVLDLLSLREGETVAAKGSPFEAAARRAPRLTDAARELQELAGEQADMVLDAEHSVPVILPAALQAVHDDARNFRRIFEAAPLGMALLSHDFTFVRTNRRLSLLTGIPPDTLLTLRLSQITGEEGEAAETLHLTGARRCETGFCEGEVLFRKPDGTEAWLRLSLALVQHLGDREANFLLMVQDVSDIKGTESELVRYHGQLEELVRERTAELAAANRKLMKEIEERLEAEDAVRALNEELETRVRERTAELEQSNSQLETMNRFFVGRELRMAELKREISRLEEEVRRLKQVEE